MRKRRQNFTLLFATVGGAIGSIASAVLISFALLDIYFEKWARTFYAIIFLCCSVMCFLSGPELAPKPFSRALGGLCVIASSMSACMRFLKDGGFVARVTSFSFLGLVLSLTLVLSIMLLGLVWVELVKDCGCTRASQDSRPSDSSTTATLRLLWLCVAAVTEGLFFGLVTGLLETKQKRPHILALPRADPFVVLPVAALLGALAGFQLERLRQDSFNLYSALENDGELVGNTLLDKDHGLGMPDSASCKGSRERSWSNGSGDSDGPSHNGGAGVQLHSMNLSF